MPHLPHSSMLITLIMMLGLAAVYDWRTGRIPNALSMIGFAAGLLLVLVIRGTEGLAESLAGAGIGLVIMLPGFVFRFTGAGDVKLFVVLGVFAGPLLTLQIFVASVLLGSVVVILHGLLRRKRLGIKSAFSRYANMLRSVLAAGHWSYLPPTHEEVLSKRVPLAPIILVGTLAVILIGPASG